MGKGGEQRQGWKRSRSRSRSSKPSAPELQDDFATTEETGKEEGERGGGRKRRREGGGGNRKGERVGRKRRGL